MCTMMMTHIDCWYYFGSVQEEAHVRWHVVELHELVKGRDTFGVLFRAEVRGEKSTKLDQRVHALEGVGIEGVVTYKCCDSIVTNHAYANTIPVLPSNKSASRVRASNCYTWLSHGRICHVYYKQKKTEVEPSLFLAAEANFTHG